MCNLIFGTNATPPYTKEEAKVAIKDVTPNTTFANALIAPIISAERKITNIAKGIFIWDAIAPKVALTQTIPAIE